MSNLSQRVKKAKALTYSHNPYSPECYSTWGSQGDDYGEKYYRVVLSHQQGAIRTPDGEKIISVFLVDCQKDTGNCKPCACPGNERHTVCYHGLGALYNSFKNNGKLISFFETYESACQMAFGGKVAKVQSANGKGKVWATIKDWPILSAQENIDLMRDSEEGID